MSSNPTRETYAELQQAYDFFNQELFAGRLHSCLITLQRQHDTYGYFSANQFASRNGESAHEIALNPSYFAVRPIEETLSVLVREMVTLDQVLHSKNKLPRRRYRNKEWADMCEAVGLMPSDTGLPGGKRVGDNVQTYIIAGGSFDLACAKLVDEQFTLSWLDRFPPKIVAAAASLVPEASLGGESEPVGETDALAAFMADDVGLAEEGGEGRQAFSSALPPSVANDTVAEFAELASEVDGEVEPVAAQVPAAGAASASSEAATSAPAMRQFRPVNEQELQAIGVTPREVTPNTSKTRFQCPQCNARAWGKPSLRICCIGGEETPHESELMIAGDQGVAHG